MGTASSLHVSQLRTVEPQASKGKIGESIDTRYAQSFKFGTAFTDGGDPPIRHILGREGERERERERERVKVKECVTIIYSAAIDLQSYQLLTVCCDVLKRFVTQLM